MLFYKYLYVMYRLRFQSRLLRVRNLCVSLGGDEIFLYSSIFLIDVHMYTIKLDRFSIVFFSRSLVFGKSAVMLPISLINYKIKNCEHT